MKSDEIRGRSFDSSLGAGAMITFVKELAAQVAEVNEKLNIILNPPLMYDSSKLGPVERMGFSDDLPQPIMFAMEPRATLRDQFAMEALQGCLSTGESADEFWVSKPESMQSTAKQAYLWADTMMEARK